MTNENRIKIIELIERIPQGQDSFLGVRPDGEHYRGSIQELVNSLVSVINLAQLNLLGISGIKSIAEIRQGEGDQGEILVVDQPPFPGAIAVYMPFDTLTPDDGANMIVTSDEKRYMITSLLKVLRPPYM